jgi:hypothetical protein
VGSRTYTIAAPGNCYVYSWNNNAFRAWLTGAGSYSYTAPAPSPTPSPSPVPTASPSATPAPSPTPSPSPTASPIPGTDPTVTTTWNGQSQTGLAPPDPTGAIGPSSYLQLINLRYGLYRRDSSLINSGDLGALTGLPVNELSDPQVVWDPSAQRFYYLVLDVARLQYAFGYSTSADPQSSTDFCKYTLDFGYGSTLTLPDYPKMAVTSDYVLIGNNTFFFLSTYNGSDLDWVNKPTSSTCPASLTGGKFSSLRNADGSLTSTPVPAVNADPSSVGWVVGDADVSSGSANFLSVFEVTKGANGNPVLGPATAIPVASYSVPASAPQPGTTATLDTLDGRLEHAVAAFDPRIGQTAIWTAHAVYGGAGSEVRWYEIGTSPTPTLAQAGAVTSPNLYIWNAAVSPDRADEGNGNAAYGSDMVVGFNTSSPNDYAAIQMVSKRGSQPQSNMVLVQQSLGPNIDNTCGPVCRWGDYSGATPDPLVSSGGMVWLSGEWNNPATDGSTVDWQTWNWAATP